MFMKNQMTNVLRGLKVHLNPPSRQKKKKNHSTGKLQRVAVNLKKLSHRDNKVQNLLATSHVRTEKFYRHNNLHKITVYFVNLLTL